MLKIATFNVNSIKIRVGLLKQWLHDEKVDVAALQEIKCENKKYPFEELEDAGYKSLVKGQRTYNGVAIVAKNELPEPLTDIPGYKTDQARFMQTEIAKDTVLICVYIPNGNPPMKTPTSKEKFWFKLDWMEALTDHLEALIKEGKGIILLGDFNVIIDDKDVYNPNAFRDNALMLPEVQEKYRQIEALGFTNVIKTFHKPTEDTVYSFWDYQYRAFDKNYGMLIDHILLTPGLAAKVKGCGIAKEMRAAERPSDHVPVWVELDI